MSGDVRGPLPIEGVRMPTWILRFDADGATTSSLTRSDLLGQLSSSNATDVVVFSHGWNNDFDAATGLYGRFLRAFEALPAAQRPSRDFRPLFVGITWPSEWLVFGDGPKIAAAPGTITPTERRAIDAMVASVAAGGGNSALLKQLLEKPTVNADEARELAALFTAVVAGVADDEGGQPDHAPSAADLEVAARALSGAERPAGDTSVDLDDYGATDAAGDAGPQAAGWRDVLDPRTYLRLASVYQMKDRAGRVGAGAMSPLLRDIQAATDAAVHCVGHSYGCKVMLSGICTGAPLTRPVDSLLLLQPAVSHLAFAARVPGTARAGGYRAVLEPQTVRHPILSTFSRKDFPLHDTFHLSLRRQGDLGEATIAGTTTSAGDPPSRFAALGGYGPRGAGQLLIDPIPMSGDAYPELGDAPIIGLDGSNGRISGHGDVTTPQTAWALAQLMFRT